MKHINSLKTNRDFQTVYNKKISFANRLLIMYIRPNHLEEQRLGISVSKKVGNSVIRHKFARMVRESFRLNRDSLQGYYDIVVIARQSAKDKNYHDIESAMLHLFKLHKILK